MKTFPESVRGIVLAATLSILPASRTVSDAQAGSGAEPFLNAVGTNNWGVAGLEPDLDLIV